MWWLEFHPGQGLSARSWYVGVGSLRILRLPPTVEKREVSGVGLVGDSKLLIGVNVSVSGSLSLCVCPATDCCSSYRHLDNSSNIATVFLLMINYKFTSNY